MKISWRTIGFVLFGLWGIVMALPSFLPEQTRNNLPSWLPHKAVTLGLDLQGGVHLLLEVETQELVKEKYSQLLGVLRKELRKESILYTNLRQLNDHVTVTLRSPGDRDKLDVLIQKHFGEGIVSKDQRQGKQMLVLGATYEERLIDQAVQKSIEVVRKRIDETGALDPVIQAQGKNRILLQIPGYDDPARVKALLGKTAKLSFQWVADAKSARSSPTVTVAFAENEASTLPIEKEVLMTGEDVLDAKASYSLDKLGRSEPAVELSLTTNGGRVFSDLTSQESHGRYMAIILDHKILSAPRINTHIPNAQASITGMKDIQSAQNLALMINSGALPAPLKILEEKVVGPGLGHDSIVQGARATVLAVAAVAVWMMAIYSFFGTFAVLGIIFNLCFLFAALVLVGATLTLPGLAGIALTVGMAVDANVLVNERIKEELKSGKSVSSAIEGGYQKAMRSILDSNITTLIGAFCLYCAGTGPVRGFAVTMGLGILISLFTAIGLTRFLVRGWVAWQNPTRVSL
jgi:preprotein translocase subunit SecD